MVLFAWGWTGFGQSGTGLPGLGVDQGINTPTIAKLPPHTKLTSLSAGSFHSACVDTKGNLYTWGNARHGECGHVSKEARSGGVGPDREEELIPRRLKMGKGIRFKTVSCGMYHTVALTMDQSVYAWGSNDLGQLGAEI
jgi:alpha-tubulin suppressor-like RCC1 family protein